ncbi:hypothetical protein GCM10023145_10820 [Angustibacter luteus]
MRALRDVAGPGSPACVAAVAPIGTAATPAVARAAIAAIVVFLFNSALLSDRDGVGAVPRRTYGAQTQARRRSRRSCGGSDPRVDGQTLVGCAEQDKP